MSNAIPTTRTDDTTSRRPDRTTSGTVSPMFNQPSRYVPGRSVMNTTGSTRPRRSTARRPVDPTSPVSTRPTCSRPPSIRRRALVLRRSCRRSTPRRRWAGRPVRPSPVQPDGQSLNNPVCWRTVNAATFPPYSNTALSLGTPCPPLNIRSVSNDGLNGTPPTVLTSKSNAVPGRVPDDGGQVGYQLADGRLGRIGPVTGRTGRTRPAVGRRYRRV